VLPDEGELRVGGTPHELAGLFDDMLVILTDDLRRVRTAKRVGYVMVVRRDGQDARRNGQRDIGSARPNGMSIGRSDVRSW
jgi:hypothetical protein